MGGYYDDARVQLWHGQALDSARELADQSGTNSIQFSDTKVQRLAFCKRLCGNLHAAHHSHAPSGVGGCSLPVNVGLGTRTILRRAERQACVGLLCLDSQVRSQHCQSACSYSVARLPIVKGAPPRRTRRLQHQRSPERGLEQFGSVQGIAPKNLMMVPARVALALQADGWILRSEIVWAKPNPMPESVTDRPTKSHEMIYLFSKSERYHYDADAIAEPVVKGAAGSSFVTGKTGVNGQGRQSQTERVEDGMRNARDVWSISTVPFPGAHFRCVPTRATTTLHPCRSQEGGLVLDPFSGSGTTGKVALMEGCSYIGFDLNSDYLDLSLRERFAQQPLDLGEAE